MPTARWNVAVSTETAQALRMFLANQGGERKGDLSRFIEEAVRAHMPELSAEEAKAANGAVSERDIDAMVDEALSWAMAEFGDADFLVTGDRRAGLIERVPHGRTRIMTPTQFCADTLKA